MISKIKLKNWRSHEQTELRFCEGTNALIGIMGGGKTSVMSAICFALFGTFPELQSKKTRLQDLIMKKPKQKEEAEVELFFEINEDEYSVKRKIEKNRTSLAELRKNSQLMEVQPAKVTDEVQKLLKVDYDLFTRAVYSEQNSLDIFLTIPKGQRMKKIDQLLAIDKFEKARNTVISLKNRCKSSISEKERLLSQLKSDRSISDVNTIKNEIKKFDGEKIKFESQLESAKRDKLSIEDRLERLKEQQKQIREIEQNLKTSIALLSNSNAEIENLKPQMFSYSEQTEEELNEKLSELMNYKKEIEENLVSEGNKLDDLKNLIALKQARIKLIQASKIPELKKRKEEKEEMKRFLKKKSSDSLAKKIRETDALMEKDINLLQKALVMLEETEKSLMELSSASALCPVCNQDISEKRRSALVNARQARIKKLKIDKTKTSSRIESLKKRIEKEREELKKAEYMEIKIKELEDVEKELKDAQESKRNISKEMEEHETEQKMLEKTIMLIKNKDSELSQKTNELKSAMERRERLSFHMKQSKELEMSISNLNNEKKKFAGFSPENISRLERELLDKSVFESSISSKLENLHMLLGEKQKRLIELEEKKKIIEEREREISRTESMISQLYLFENALFSTQEQLRKNFISAVNQTMHSIWQDIYPYKDFYSARLKIDGGDYVLQLQDSTGWVNADGIVSGGERSIACLALRIAFSLVLAPQLKILVLDEPTHNLDARAVEDLANVLREKITEFVEQAFLITHDPSLESAVSGFLYRLEREKENDGTTNVICISKPDEF